jgi:hypothetical protein
MTGQVLRLSTPDGRIAWYCGNDTDRAAEMAADLFPGVDVVIDVSPETAPASRPPRSGRSPA